MLKFRRVKRPVRRHRRNPDVSTLLLLGGLGVGGFLLVRYLMARRTEQLALAARGVQAGAGMANLVGLSKPPAKSTTATDRLRYEYRTGSAGRACFDKQTGTFTNIEKCDAAFVLEGVGGIFSGGRGLGSL